MAEVLDDAQFWLPPQFLTDDDFFVDGVKATTDTKNLKDSESLFPYEFTGRFGSFGFPPDLSSPVESVLGSTETESDGEDYLAELTRQMAHSTLKDDSLRMDPAFASENPKGWVLSSSPQSTLCPLPSGCGCKQVSSRGSPNYQSRVSSPPATWDLLHAAAGEVERLRMKEEKYVGFSNRGLSGPPDIKPSPNLDASGVYPHNKLRTTHFQQLKQENLMKQQNALAWGRMKQQQQNHVIQNRVRYGYRTLGLPPSAWPPLQQQQQQQPQPPNWSGMRAVFLGNPNGKRECVGTGVFLPRRVGNSSEPRKKPACSTVLVPARVAQALNLNLDQVGAQSQPHNPRFNSSFTSDAAAMRLRSGGNFVGNQRQKNLRPQQEISHEVRLPQEWTY
ncbi:hypothetical protein V6N12_050005 [Hibiscus sabdariffa]|uniref:TIP41-like protein n=1 Tax=Hibiscus sabdariffa TaxID=183260 RepID=A0ABR2GB67_9ROSI